MKSVSFKLSYVLFGFLVSCCFLLLPIGSRAQGTGSLGNNAVYNSSSACCIGTSAFIDAFITQGANDFCATIYNILQAPNYPAAGAVIDARGISSSLTCANGTSPWLQSSHGYQNKPSTILLPAGTINIPAKWVLPNGTRLIGEGTSNPDLNSGNGQLQTTIQATSSLASGPMIQFGDSHCPGVTPTCTGISVESLTLVGNGQSLTGIQNQNSQDFTYVNHVTLYHVLGTGLDISGNAVNSGPYSDITYDTGTSGLFASTCVSINGLATTRGIHGLTCNSSPDSQHAVLLDSSNNSVEDVRIVGFYDGILIGANAPARSNVLLNVMGDTTPLTLSPVNVVHISANNAVTDISVMGVYNSLGGNSGQYTIDDDVTSTPLPDLFVAMYVLGEARNGGYTRYTTSKNAATWTVGNSAPPASSCPRGSLYSCIGSSSNCSNFALWGCDGSAWKKIK